MRSKILKSTKNKQELTITKVDKPVTTLSYSRKFRFSNPRSVNIYDV